MMQRTGKKSYARVREELKVVIHYNCVVYIERTIELYCLLLLRQESLSGREPSRMELFVACFSKDGITKNVEAANAIVCYVCILFTTCAIFT